MNFDNSSNIEQYILENPDCYQKKVKIVGIPDKEYSVHKLPINLLETDKKNVKNLEYEKERTIERYEEYLKGREVTPNIIAVATLEGILLEGNRVKMLFKKIFEDSKESKFQFLDTVILDISIKDNRKIDKLMEEREKFGDFICY